jgi:hypothetical protein
MMVRGIRQGSLMAVGDLWYELLGAVERVRQAAGLSVGVAQQAVHWACARREIRSLGEGRRSMDPLHLLQRCPSVDLKWPDWQGRLIDDRGFLAPRSGEDSVIVAVYVNHADLEWWLDNRLQWWLSTVWESPDPSEAPSVTPIRGRPAGSPAIRDAIRAVYDEAERTGEKPPNINEIAAPVQAKLTADGRGASKRQIQKIADEPEFAARRGPLGVTIAAVSRQKQLQASR